MFTLRFDLRSAASAPLPDLYAAAIEMSSWAETRGGVAVLLSEHHAAEDNHLPSPLMLASAIAARTERIAIMLAAIVLPLYDPIRLAEDIGVLDNISRGRVSHVLAIGHRREEYEHFGADYERRGRIADEKLDLLLELLKGRTIVRDGRRTHVTPPPTSAGGARILIAGGSAAAVKRAARRGLGFVGQANVPGLAELYVAECRAHGHEPGMAQFPSPDAPSTVFVAEDVDKAWEELGPYMLHDAMMAASYRHGDVSVASITTAQTVEELRRARGPYRIYTPQEAAAELRSGRPLALHPLCGGAPPALAWPYLEEAAAAVALAT
jgi:alkanesulfonate monooxygenase SsuD/methylene tetrahydromethanopterin reductase-like flavin-dependent oxidoreductase (luciferase family)